jgi:predicted restriction endonuclease
MSNQKKAIRKAFREDCFKRDDYRCVCCGFKPEMDKVNEQLDAHHIQDRNLMPNGGYVKQNGISLCLSCHEKAEQLHRTGVAFVGYTCEELYAKIGSSLDEAIKASLMGRNGSE